MNHPGEHQRSGATFFGRQIPRDVQLSEPQLRAVEFLERCVRELKSLAAVTGEAGTGKTVALNAALTRLEGTGRRIVRFSNFVAGPLSMHRTIGASLGVARANELSVAEINHAIRTVLANKGLPEPPVLAVDDAQSLTPETLQYICMLALLRDSGHPRFCVLLVGRPGFEGRQDIPPLFRLQAVRPEDATLILRRGLAESGVDASDETVQILVRHSGGNLRVLDSLMRGRVEDGQSLHTPRRKPERERSSSPAVGRTAEPRRSSLGLWLTAPVCIAVGAAGATATFHYGLFGKPEKTTQIALLSPTENPKPGSFIPQRASMPVIHSEAMPATVTGPPAPAVQATPTGTYASNRASAPVPPLAVPVLQVPASAALPSMAIPAPTPTLARQDQSGNKSTTAFVPQPATPRVRTAEAIPPALSMPLNRFRVLNSGSCHHEVCSRWEIFDLDRRKRLVAGLDLSALKLDFGTALKARLGVVELTVTGFLKTSGAAGRIVVAKSLDSVTPHHPRVLSKAIAMAGSRAQHDQAIPDIPGGWSKALMPTVDQPSASSQ